MTIVLAGLQEGIVKGNTLFNLPSAFGYLGAAYLGKVPVSLIVTVIIFVGTGLFLRYHRIGRAIYAVGGNREAARAAGHQGGPDPARRLHHWQHAGRHRRPDGSRAGLGGHRPAGLPGGIIFAVFAAAVIGGVSLQGGRGNMVGAASGVILLGLVQNILDLANAPNYWIEAIDGAVILVALVLARLIGGEKTAE